MHPIFEAFERSEGYLRRRDLVGLGMTDAHLRRAVAEGRLRRVRHGWYHLPGAWHDGEHAVRVGGLLTGVAALRTYGVWIPAGSPVVDITVPSHARALRHPDDMRRRLADHCAIPIRVHWQAEPISPATSVWRVEVIPALVLAIRMSSMEDSVILTDSCLHLDLIDVSDLDRLRESLPARCRSWIGHVDRRSESGGETAARLRLRAVGIEFEPQVEVPGVGRLDGRIGRRTFIEVDGFSAHNSANSHERDRERMLVSTLWNHQVLHFSSRQVFEQWPLCLSATHAALEHD